MHILVSCEEYIVWRLFYNPVISEITFLLIDIQAGVSLRQTALGEMELHVLTVRTQRIYQQESRSKVVMRELVLRGGNWTRGYLFLLTAGSHRDGGENPRSRRVLIGTSLKNTSLSITMSRHAGG